MVNVTGGRPGVFQPETDLSQIIREASSDIGAIVGAFPKGPINKRILITNTRDLITLFGNPNTAYGYAAHSATCALEAMNKLYVTRVTSADALSSAILVNAAGSTSETTTAVSGAIPGGQEVHITTQALIATTLAATSTYAFTLPMYSVISDLNDLTLSGISLGPLTVNKTNPASWTIAGTGLSGTVSTLNPSTGALSITLSATPAAGQELKAFYTTDSAARLFSVVAENPGVWGNALRVAVENVNATDSTFELVVSQIVEGVQVELERHLVSRLNQLDGFNRQQYLEDVINDNSIYIRVYDNLAQDEAVLPDEFTATALAGGNAGSAVSNADVIEGWDLYSNTQEVQVDLLINGGYVSSIDFSVQSKMKSICETRDDCFAILDTPVDELSMFPTPDLSNWRTNVQNFNTSYTAIYGPWAEVYDSFNDKRNVPIPMSGFVAQVYARRAQNTEAWYPPAGFNDGIIDSGALPFIKLTHRYTPGQQDILYNAGVNFLVTEPGTGTAVFGDKTQQTKASALDRVNVRRLLNVLKRAHKEFLKFKLFELNTPFLRNEVTAVLTDYLNGVVARQGLTSFRVYCNDLNNPPSVIDSNQLSVDIYIQPTRSINYIKNEFVITRTGVNFDTIFNARLPS